MSAVEKMKFCHKGCAVRTIHSINTGPMRPDNTKERVYKCLECGATETTELDYNTLSNVFKAPKKRKDS